MELDAIVPIVDENVELFRIFWPPDPHMVQARPGICLIVMVRRAAGGRVLVAMPTALVPAGSLPLEPEESDVIGPHAQFELPAVRMSDGGIEHLGTDVTVQVVDLGADALSALTPLSLVPESEDQGSSVLERIWTSYQSLHCWKRVSRIGSSLMGHSWGSEGRLLLCGRRGGLPRGSGSSAAPKKRSGGGHHSTRAVARQAEDEGPAQEEGHYSCAVRPAIQPHGTDSLHGRADLRSSEESGGFAGDSGAEPEGSSSPGQPSTCGRDRERCGFFRQDDGLTSANQVTGSCAGDSGDAYAKFWSRWMCPSSDLCRGAQPYGPCQSLHAGYAGAEQGVDDSGRSHATGWRSTVRWTGILIERVIRNQRLGWTRKAAKRVGDEVRQFYLAVLQNAVKRLNLPARSRAQWRRSRPPTFR